MTTAVIPSWTLGDRIRKARTTVGMDQRQFAEALGVKAGTLAGWEADNSKPRELVDVAMRIEEITSVPASWILGVGSLERKTPRDVGGRHGGLRGITAEYRPQKSTCLRNHRPRSTGISPRLSQLRRNDPTTAQ